MLENGTADRPLLPRHASAQGQVQPRRGVSASGPASTGRQIPEAALVCNLPGGEPGDPGPDDARRRGDVLPRVRPSGAHAAVRAGTSGSASAASAPSRISSRRRRRCSRSGRWDPATLQTFAKHYQTNEPIPAALVRADAARERVRQGAQRPAADGVREAVAVDLRPRSEDRRHDRDGEGAGRQVPADRRTSRARTSRRRSAISTATRRSTTPTCGRSSSRRTCSASSIAAEPARAGGRREVPRRGPRAGRIEARRHAGARFPRPAVRLQGVGSVAQSGRSGDRRVG